MPGVSLWHNMALAGQDRRGPATANMAPIMLEGPYEAFSPQFGPMRQAQVENLMVWLPHGAEFERDANGCVRRNDDGTWARARYSLTARQRRYNEGLDALCQDDEFGWTCRLFRLMGGVGKFVLYVGAIDDAYLAMSERERDLAIRPLVLASPDYIVIDGAGVYCTPDSPHYQELLRLDQYFPNPCAIEPRPGVKMDHLANRVSFTLQGTIDQVGGFDFAGWIPRDQLTAEHVVMDNVTLVGDHERRLALAQAARDAGFGFTTGTNPEDLAFTPQLRQVFGGIST
jgi:hypothetical protein